MNGKETVRIAASGFELVKIDELVPYERNAKKHSKEQIKKVRASLREFGFVAPVLIDREKNVLAGHGRIEAAKAEGMDEVPCVLADGLSEAQRRAYIIADNRLMELGEWDMETMQFEMRELNAMGFDTEVVGFELNAGKDGKRLALDVDALSTDGIEGDAEYQAFVEKFEPKLTTDDCYTPPAVYKAARAWAVEHYGLEDAQIVRPFYPGGDYQRYEYPTDCVVIDNPPFSILSEICRFFMEREIRFFLFAPALTLFSTGGGECNYIATSCNIVYENGALVKTAFVSNMGEYKIETAPELYKAINEANGEAKKTVELPVYEYPDCVIALARVGLMAQYEKIKIKAESCHFIRALDAQKDTGKSVYGAAFLLSEKATAEKAAAEKAAAEKAAAEKAAAKKRRAAKKWTLSEREQRIVAALK